MIGYVIGIILIVLSLLDYLYRRNIFKNRIEIDAIVVKMGKTRRDLETGDTYFPVFRYDVDGKRYETKLSLGDSKYSIGTVTRIYAYKYNPKRIVIPDQIKVRTGADVFFMLMGVVVVCYQIFSI